MLNFKDVKVGGQSPILKPGNHKVRILKIYLDRPAYTNTGYNVVLLMETEPVGGEFKGLLVDPQKENGPRFKGQVGRVKVSRYTFEDTTLPSGVELKRDNEIMKMIVRLANAMGKEDAIRDISAQTIEEAINKVSKVLSSKNDYMDVCIAGREYLSKDEYVNFDLFLPKFKAGENPIGEDCVEFDAIEHIVPLKNKPKTEAPASDFSLDGDDDDDDDDFGFDF